LPILCRFFAYPLSFLCLSFAVSLPILCRFFAVFRPFLRTSFGLSRDLLCYFFAVSLVLYQRNSKEIAFNEQRWTYVASKEAPTANEKGPNKSRDELAEGGTLR